MNFSVDVIKPGKTLEIPITFYPREAVSYRELIPFEINGLSQQTVEVKGKGTEMKVRDHGWGWGTLLLPLPRLLPTGTRAPRHIPSSLLPGMLHPTSSGSTESVPLVIEGGKEFLNQAQSQLLLGPRFNVLATSVNCKHQRNILHLLGEASHATSHWRACLM